MKLPTDLPVSEGHGVRHGKASTTGKSGETQETSGVSSPHATTKSVFERDEDDARPLLTLSRSTLAATTTR